MGEHRVQTLLWSQPLGSLAQVMNRIAHDAFSHSLVFFLNGPLKVIDKRSESFRGQGGLSLMEVSRLLGVVQFGSKQGVLEKRCDSHGAYASRYRGDMARSL
ncbi:hypothetical protein SAMN05443545_105169 [Aidingimonas halophila]|uniref:Uncharacterized protein n=1 Tax=Aidingimonas halophila TaxID=574349 RepID=A0A1H3BAJ5_9GAMM|nr:hypothetical protein SAMN05443545_105169 [Aidingimonas halophila]